MKLTPYEMKERIHRLEGALVKSEARAEAAEKRIKDHQEAWKDSEEDLINRLEAAEKEREHNWQEYLTERTARMEANGREAAWQARAEAAEKLLSNFMEAAMFDALMEGPRFKGWDRSQLDRAYRAAFETLRRQ